MHCLNIQHIHYVPIFARLNENIKKNFNTRLHCQQIKKCNKEEFLFNLYLNFTILQQSYEAQSPDLTLTFDQLCYYYIKRAWTLSQFRNLRVLEKLSKYFDGLCWSTIELKTLIFYFEKFDNHLKLSRFQFLEKRESLKVWFKFLNKIIEYEIDRI
ncbi:hypothetical protein BpHYR1_016528 [Brachionus plicatilis]|uniref:Uncharacterized protein n=1 Tax=Brachionus plicatilis TaxID=10195 RepID=A0A3M7R772_BRAPC|nr:hypothetical protein BpHYR1_016528 [Brachionus plicatilis]